MIISDLNYLENFTEANVEGGTHTTFYENDVVISGIYAGAFVYGNSADAFADSVAVGLDSFSKTVTFTYVTPVTSVSSSASFAATDDWF